MSTEIEKELEEFAWKKIIELDKIIPKYWNPALVKDKPFTYTQEMKGWLSSAIFEYTQEKDKEIKQLKATLEAALRYCEEWKTKITNQ